MTPTHIHFKELKRAEYNPRIMPDSEMQALKESISKFGFVEPVVVNSHEGRKGVLIGGHQRTTALEQILAKGVVPNGIIRETDGGFLVPATFVNLNIEEEKALNLALNKIKGKWDEGKLAEIIIGLRESPIITATGFRDDEISKILDQNLPEAEDPIGEGEGEGAEPRSKPGEVYELGTHRLICGDSSKPETYEKLMQGEKADMIWTDPPYNVAYKSDSENLSTGGVESIKNDSMPAADFQKMADEWFAAMVTPLREGGSIYACTGWSSYPAFVASMTKVGIRQSTVIVWVKNSGTLGWQDYKSKQEWIAKAKKEDKKTAEAIMYAWKEGKHTFYGDNEYDVWEMPRKSVLHYIHPTEKPDWLPMRAIRNSTKRGDIVLDPFGGSGSCMAAAEKIGRRAFMIELDPKFCDRIRDRWDRIEKQKLESIVK